MRQVARFDVARALYLKMLAVKRRTLGDSHPDTLASISNTALLLQNEGSLARRSRFSARRYMGFGAHRSTRTPPR